MSTSPMQDPVIPEIPGLPNLLLNLGLYLLGPGVLTTLLAVLVAAWGAKSFFDDAKLIGRIVRAVARLFGRTATHVSAMRGTKIVFAIMVTIVILLLQAAWLGTAHVVGSVLSFIWTWWDTGQEPPSISLEVNQVTIWYVAIAAIPMIAGYLSFLRGDGATPEGNKASNGFVTFLVGTAGFTALAPAALLAVLIVILDALAVLLFGLIWIFDDVSGETWHFLWMFFLYALGFAAYCVLGYGAYTAIVPVAWAWRQKAEN